MTLDSVIATTNTDVEGKRRRNTDAPIDDRRTASVIDTDKLNGVIDL